MSMPTITLGQQYRDSVSGWTGTATARYEYLNGCVRFEISDRDKDGKPESFVFDEQQLEPVEEGPVSAFPAPRPTGGPRDNRPVAR